MRYPYALLAIAAPLLLAACDGSPPPPTKGDTGSVAAPSVAKQAVEQAVGAVSGTLTDPASGAQCAGKELHITRDDFNLVVEGTCGEVVISASRGSVNVSDAASIRVEGSHVTVLNEQVGAVDVTGGNNTLNLTRVGPLNVSGNDNLVLAHEIASVVFSGNGNTANPDNEPPLQDSGSGNKLM